MDGAEENVKTQEIVLMWCKLVKSKLLLIMAYTFTVCSDGYFVAVVHALYPQLKISKHKGSLSSKKLLKWHNEH